MISDNATTSYLKERHKISVSHLENQRKHVLQVEKYIFALEKLLSAIKYFENRIAFKRIIKQ